MSNLGVYECANCRYYKTMRKEYVTNNFEERLAYPKTTPVSKINNINLLLIGDSFSWNILKQLEDGPFINSYNFAYYVCMVFKVSRYLCKNQNATRQL